MRIVVDIRHPAHVHLFKNFIWEMKKRGHEFLITAGKKEVSLRLLDNYSFAYVNMGSYGNSRLRKAASVPIMDLKMYQAVKKFKPDILIGTAPIHASHASRLIRKPCIAFDDSEPSPYEILLYRYFVDVIITPSCFRKDLGKKQIRLNGYKELAYLHPNRFKPDPSVLGALGVRQDDRFIIVRFVSWQAVHDVRQHGFDMGTKRRLVTELQKYARVFITSESPLPGEFEKYRITLPPERLHDLLYYATLLIGDTQTMTTEAAVLGTPAVRCNSFVGPNDMGNFIELERKYGLIYSFREPEKALSRAIELLKQQNLKQEWMMRRETLLSEKIDVTQFMVDFVENYPESVRRYRDGKNRS